jgi:5,10-methenyltetrahydromethanopterin hydrogenase
MLNFTAVAPVGVKALDYAGIKPYRPDTAGQTAGYINFVRNVMREAVADLYRLMESLPL